MLVFFIMLKTKKERKLTIDSFFSTKMAFKNSTLFFVNISDKAAYWMA